MVDSEARIAAAATALYRIGVKLSGHTFHGLAKAALAAADVVQASEAERLRTVLSMLVEAANYTGDDGGRWDDALSFARAELAGSASPTNLDATKDALRKLIENVQLAVIYWGDEDTLEDLTEALCSYEIQARAVPVVDVEQKDAT